MMRSLVAPLFVPGNKSGLFAKAAASGADAVIYDLEDAVSLAEKNIARQAVAARAKTSLYEIVRVNAPSSGLLEEDLQVIRDNPPSAVMVAKAEAGRDLAVVTEMLGTEIELIPLIETARALAALPDILGMDRVRCAAFGSIDFALDIGCSQDRLALLSARSELVLRSRLANRGSPIDGVTVTIDDPAAVTDDALHAKSLGFGGKLAIHPRQIGPILSSFSATDDEIAWARRVLQSLQDGNASKVDGEMIDRPLIERARSILAASNGQ